MHDVTIAYHNYGDGGPPSEKTMLSGQLSCFFDTTTVSTSALEVVQCEILKSLGSFVIFNKTGFVVTEGLKV